MRIRKATLQDLTCLLQLYQYAQDFMIAQGNPTQWGKYYPNQEIIEADIRSESLWICEEDNEVLAAFFFAPGPDACYEKIKGGNWIEPEKTYWVIHRVASYGKRKGVATQCLQWCCEQQDNVRIDTHRDNIPMQHLLKKCGFVFCGIIELQNGAERLAFQKCMATNKG